MQLRVPSIVERNTVLSLWCFLTACSSASTISPPVSHPLVRPSPVPWCVSPGSKVDSAFAVKQALSPFASDDLPVMPHSVERIEARIVGKDSSVTVTLLEGWLIRLMPINRMTLGGGGLVWVDGETGCPIVLKRYE